MKVKKVSDDVPVVSFIPHPRKPAKQTPIAIANPAGQSEDLSNMSVSALWDRIKSSVENLQEQDLDGRQRRRLASAKLVHLGAKPLAPPKVPAKILMGMREKAKKRKSRKQHDRNSAGGDMDVFATDEYKKVHVVNAQVYAKRPKEERVIREREEQRIKYRSRPSQ